MFVPFITDEYAWNDSIFVREASLIVRMRILEHVSPSSEMYDGVYIGTLF